MRRVLLLVTLGLIALAGCGADDEPATTTETTATHAETAPATVTAPTETTPPTAPPSTVTEPSDDGGGVPAPGNDTERRPEPEPAPKPEPEPDSPTNDLPPPADSPAERFEKECEQKPGSCG